MSKTRNNHYVPQWYQEGFFEPGRNTLAYLDLTPDQKTLTDGRIITHRALFDAPTSRAFQQYDLYSTFFGTSVNDEIERYLFGDIDGRGSKAIRAYAGTDVGEWHRHFKTLFEYIDIQKVRTPKGLDWLAAQYPSLTQNELMFEMQGIRMMHCTLWTEGVREIVSAEESEVKFILTDHPVTVYNYAVPPDAEGNRYPHDPSTALKASQTIFPLTRDFCLLLTNLEYAKAPSTSPLEKRTFARNYRTSMVRTDAFIRKRKLSRLEVAKINYVLKARARRYIAAGRKEWLYPERTVNGPWAELRHTLLPPKREMHHFGGEIFVGYEDGGVHYQDEFGRTEKPRDFLKKAPPAKPLRPQDDCGCGSGLRFSDCCQSRPPAMRPVWDEVSIRERNVMLYNAIVNILGFDSGKSWLDIRRDLTDKQISEIYFLFSALWPLETDLLKLLPRPEGKSRAIYTGSIHPSLITDFALGASLYFGELIMEHPFVHPGILREKYNPVANPKVYRQEFLKAVVFFMTVMPLVDRGLINLIPDPGTFDAHLREQTVRMARARAAGIKVGLHDDERLDELLRKDFQRDLMMLPPDALRRQLLKASPGVEAAMMDDVMQAVERMKEDDPLAVLQDDSLMGGESGGQFNVMKLAPNFEMTMFLAQATGSCIITDSRFRWAEITRNVTRSAGQSQPVLASLAGEIRQATFAFPQEVGDMETLASERTLDAYPALMRDLKKYAQKAGLKDGKANFEKHLAARFNQTHLKAQAAIAKARISTKQARMSCVIPTGGIQDNTVNRLLLMSSTENYLPNVPMAFFIEDPKDRKAARLAPKTHVLLASRP